MAGKSFADKVRDSAKTHNSSDILNRIERIKRNSKDISNNSDDEQNNNLKPASGKDSTLTPEHLDTLATKQVPKQVPKHLDTLATQQLNTLTSKQVDTLTPEHLDTLIDIKKPPFNINLKPKDLLPNQFRILYEIYFERPFKVKGPHRIGGSINFLIPYGTVRYILISLRKKGYIFTPFSVNSGEFKGTTCQVNESKCRPLFGSSPIINSEQIKTPIYQHLNTLTPQHLDTSTSKQVDTLTPEHQDSSYKLVSKYLNKLTNYLKYSEFWNNQGLNIKKCEEWINEFEFLKNNPELLVTQLMFAEKTDSVLSPKSKTPVHVFYGCLKNGGLTRPKNFEFPEERAIRIKREDLELKRKILADQTAIREQEKILADEEAFIEFLNDKENINFLIIEIEKRFMTPKTKNSIKLYRKKGQIDSRLENALKIEFTRND